MKHINIGVLAHVDAGKTTTVEQILYKTGQTRALGKIEKGDTQTDWLSIERKRGISVKSSSVSFLYQDRQVNIIDTPGHMDFAGEVERVLSVLDAAVLVVSALEGIQAHTEILWNALLELKIPTILFVNKVDRNGCVPEELLSNLRYEFSPYIFPINQTIRAGEKDVSLTSRELTEAELFLLGEKDEILEMLLLEEKPITSKDREGALFRGTKKAEVSPLLFGAAAVGLGIDTLLESIFRFFPFAEGADDAPVSGMVYKIEHDKAMGKITHIRMFSGALHNRDMVLIRREKEEPVSEKITQIRRVSGAKREDSGILHAGDIGAIYGLSGAKTGDIIGEWMGRKQYSMATPLFSVKISAAPERITELRKAVAELSDEDPLLDYEWVSEKKELLLRIMGPIQIEILEYLLMENYGLPVTFSPPSVIYKETPMRKGVGMEAYTMPKPCWAVVALEAEPLPQGSGFVYETENIREEKLFTRYRNHIKESVKETLRQGLYGWEVTDLRIRLLDGEHHLMHTHPMDFFLATPIGVMKALLNAKTTLLEPVMNMKITADEALSGKIIGEIISMRGEFDNPLIQKGKVMIEAKIPVSTSLDFPIWLSSVTAGRGVLRASFSGYQKCALELGAETPRRGINPLDREAWILHMRGALHS